MREISKIRHSINEVRALLSELEERSERGFEQSFGAVHDRLTVAVGELPYTHTLELEGPSSSTASTSATAKQTANEASQLAASSISLETSRRLRRMGLDPKFVGIKTEGDLFDMKHAEKGGK